MGARRARRSGCSSAGRILGLVQLAVLAVAAAAHARWSRIVWVRAHTPALARPARAEGAAAGRRAGPRRRRGRRRPRSTADARRSTTRSTAAGAPARLLLAPLHAGEEARAAYRFPTDRRGRFEVGPLRATVTDPFGLVSAHAARARHRAGDRVSARARHRCRRPRSGGLDLDRDQPQVRSRIEPSGEFHTLRDYAPGDDLRHVHWRSTARRGHLMMRQNEARRRTPVLVMLDVRPGAHDRASFERAVEACASIVTAIDRARPAGRSDARAPARRSATPGRRHLGSVMDELAVVEPHGPERIVAAETRRRTGALVAIVGRVRADDAAALGVLDP